MPVPNFEYQYDLCRDHDFYHLNKYAKRALKEAIEPLKPWIEPPFNKDFNYCWLLNWTYEERLESWAQFYFDRSVIAGDRFFCGDIKCCSEYKARFEYLHYWFVLCSEVHTRALKKEYNETQKQLEKEKRQGSSEDVIRHLENCLERNKKRAEELKETYSCSIRSLEEFSEWLVDSFILIYNGCIERHNHPIARYERGRIYFERGESVNFIQDIAALIAMGQVQTPQMIFELGKAYNDANQYNQAIKVLSEAIKKDPLNKEAYFERATAYFEIGNFQFALADYIKSDVRPNRINADKDHFQYTQFAKGITLGCFKGGSESAIHFIPSLFASAYGLGKGLWALTADPIGVSKELVDSCIACVEFIKDNISPELLAQIVPELKECIENWDQLEEDKKGYYIGYVIGRYGVDILAWGGCARGIKLFRDIKRANSALTMESAVVSAKSLKEISISSEKYFKTRQEYTRKCWLHLGQQEKHIPGSNNFKLDAGKSELLIDVKKLDKLTRPKIGSGIVTRDEFGTERFKELVDYGEIIGVQIEEKAGICIRTPTSIGEIHYDKKAGYHVVPVHPSKWVKVGGYGK